MKNLELPPKGYVLQSEGVMSNFDHAIDDDVAKGLKKDKLIAPYPGRNFFGMVWWDRKRRGWSCTVECYKQHMETIHAKTLQEIMDEVSGKYGGE